MQSETDEYCEDISVKRTEGYKEILKPIEIVGCADQEDKGKLEPSRIVPVP